MLNQYERYYKLLNRCKKDLKASEVKEAYWLGGTSKQSELANAVIAALEGVGRSKKAKTVLTDIFDEDDDDEEHPSQFLPKTMV